MNTIYKYKVNFDITPTIISMPKNSVVLNCGIDGYDQTSIWAIVDTATAEKEDRTFWCVGTGWNLDSLFKGYTVEYIGTATDFQGLVYHFFETKGKYEEKY